MKRLSVSGLAMSCRISGELHGRHVAKATREVCEAIAVKVQPLTNVGGGYTSAQFQPESYE